MKNKILYNSVTNEPYIEFQYNTGDKSNDVSLFDRIIEQSLDTNNKLVFEVVVSPSGVTTILLKAVAI